MGMSFDQYWLITYFTIMQHSVAFSLSDKGCMSLSLHKPDFKGGQVIFCEVRDIDVCEKFFL